MSTEAPTWYDYCDRLEEQKISTQDEHESEEMSLIKSGIDMLFMTGRTFVEEMKAMPLDLFDQALPINFQSELVGWLGSQTAEFDFSFIDRELVETVSLVINGRDSGQIKISFKRDLKFTPGKVNIDLQSPQYDSWEVSRQEVRKISDKNEWEEVSPLEIVRAVNLLADRYAEQFAQPNPSAVASA